MSRTGVVAEIPALGEIRLQIEQWRGTRAHRTAMPEDLWQSAAAVARVHGLHLVARALHLDYYSLKRRLEVNGGNSPDAQPAFIEVGVCPAAAKSGSGEFVVEMERADGARMRVRLSDDEALVRLSESFWRGPA